MNHWIYGFAAAALLLTGCGAAPEQALQEEELEPTDTIEEGIGEASCALTPFDHYFNQVTSDKSVTSPNSAYDHPNDPICRHAYVVGGGFPQLLGTQGIATWYEGPSLTGSGFPCNAAWVRAIVWKLVAGSWVQQQDTTAYGTQSGGTCFKPFVVTAPSLGEYKVAAAAGVLFTYMRVKVEMYNH
jgi:hypothetical protein